jgi:hypothetical protein
MSVMNVRHLSITSSACASSVGGTSMPSAFAVLRLTMLDGDSLAVNVAKRLQLVETGSDDCPVLLRKEQYADAPYPLALLRACAPHLGREQQTAATE